VCILQKQVRIFYSAPNSQLAAGLMPITSHGTHWLSLDSNNSWGRKGYEGKDLEPRYFETRMDDITCLSGEHHNKNL